MTVTPPDSNMHRGHRDLLGIFPLKATSAERAWEGVLISEFDAVHLDELIVPARDHPHLTVCTGTAPGVLQQRCGKRFFSPSGIGECSIKPSGRKSLWRGFVPSHVSIRLDPGKLDEAVGDLRRTGGRRFEFSNVFRMRDPVVEHIAAIFRLELNRPSHPAQDLLIQSLAVSLSAHLLRGYTNAAGVEARNPGAPKVAALERAVSYIEDHPDRSVSLHDLAGAAGVSRFHFSRLFKAQFGVSPVRYVERRRIEHAKVLIIAGEQPLAWVAQTVGFSDQSHFSRRFRSYEGCSPGEFARANAKRLLPRS